MREVWNLITGVNPFFDFFPFRVALNISKYTRKTEHWLRDGGSVKRVHRWPQVFQCNMYCNELL